MTNLSLSVNGEPCQVEVEERTQLAELLRDQLKLTATHLGCEQGICGACTVLIDGKPTRSCITYAGACQGKEITTLEGFDADEIMRQLREAFTRHHALQCGFCTPGMLVTAFDIVSRMDNPDEMRIRQELSGNLCRCTGYMGIVAAISDVMSQRRSKADVVPVARQTLALNANGRAFKPFKIAQQFGRDTNGLVQASAELRSDGATVIRNQFLLSHPVEKAGELFEDLSTLARCLPGAEITEIDGDHFKAKIALHFGPVKAGFLLEGRREADVQSRTGMIKAMGQDANGQSKASGELKYALTSGDTDQKTRVDLTLVFLVQGALAQFNRQDLVESFAGVILDQFSRNCEAVLAGHAHQVKSRLGLFTVLLEIIRNQIKKLLGHRD